MRARNRCNHRDFQNIGVNGARVGSMVRTTDSMDALVKQNLQFGDQSRLGIIHSGKDRDGYGP